MKRNDKDMKRAITGLLTLRWLRRQWRADRS